VLRDLWQWIKSIFKHWFSLMAGAVSVLLGVIEKWGFLPAWLYWSTAGLCFLFAIFSSWRDERKEKRALAARLTPHLAILDEVAVDGGYHRIRVKNLSPTSCRFGVNLTGLEPSVPELTQLLPVPLRSTHDPNYPMSTLSGSGESLVDVVATANPLDRTIQISGPGGRNYANIPNQRYKFTVRAHSETGGVPIEKTILVDFRKQPPDFLPLA